jgi:hypothetical protein
VRPDNEVNQPTAAQARDWPPGPADRGACPAGSHPRSLSGKKKLHEGTDCPQCGAVYHDARWQWLAKGAGSVEELCAACRRINDKFPAGILTLHGAFAGEHKQEMLRLARHQEEIEKKEHPSNGAV